MLPPLILNVADRLAAILMALVDAISPIALAGSTPTFTDRAARTLFFRLVTLVATLIRISNFGIRAPRKPEPATPSRIPPEPAASPTRRAPAPSLPRRPGWLLAALPDIAPAIAADLEIILADPAFAALLGAAPSLHRTLRPLLRALGLTATPPANAPPPNAPSPPARPTTPRPAASQDQTPQTQPPRRNRISQPMPICVQIVT